MKISELFRHLSYGELSNLAISNSGSGSIVTEKHSQLIQYTNTALTAIFTRFVLNEKELAIELDSSVTVYHLSTKHSESVGTDTHKYIVDTPEDPFNEDRLIRILEVWGNVNGDFQQLPLNDQNAPESLFTPTARSLQVPSPQDGAPLSILYQAFHERLIEVPVDDDTPIDLDQIIRIPYYLNNALLKRIASEVYSHMNGQENLLKSQEYLAAYEASCLDVEQRDLASQSWATTHTKLEQRGFV